MSHDWVEPTGQGMLMERDTCRQDNLMFLRPGSPASCLCFCPWTVYPSKQWPRNCKYCRGTCHPKAPVMPWGTTSIVLVPAVLFVEMRMSSCRLCSCSVQPIFWKMFLWNPWGTRASSTRLPRERSLASVLVHEAPALPGSPKDGPSPKQSGLQRFLRSERRGAAGSVRNVRRAVRRAAAPLRGADEAELPASRPRGAAARQIGR